MSPQYDPATDPGSVPAMTPANGRPGVATNVRCRVRQVVRLDLSGLVDAVGMLDDVEVRSRLCGLAADVEDGQAVVLDVGDATWTMPHTFTDLASAVQDAGTVQVQGSRGSFVRQVAEQLDRCLW